MIARTTAEKGALREGGRKLGSILARLKEEAKPGVSSAALDAHARELIAQEGGEPAFLGYRPRGAPRAFPAALCVSVNDAIVHGIPNEQPTELQDGDIVSLDLGLVYKGFVTDAAVIALVGNASEEDIRLARAVEEALVAAVKAARTGARTGDIGAAVEAVARKYGYAIPYELGGHGVGGSVHEDPFVPNFGKAGAGPELAEGQVLAIEPMFAAGKGDITSDPDGYTLRTKDGSRTAQAEHTVIVTPDGGEILTKES